jgi:hypothetical protein
MPREGFTPTKFNGRPVGVATIPLRGMKDAATRHFHAMKRNAEG